MLHRFRGGGLYLLDEPEAALSPQRQLAVLARIHDLVREDSQFVIATHSPILMAYPEAYIYSFSTDGIERLDYYEIEHYQVMHDFLLDPRLMLAALLESRAADQKANPAATIGFDGGGSIRAPPGGEESALHTGNDALQSYIGKANHLE